MNRLMAAGVLGLALLAAAPASADPEDLLPHCASGQEPTTGECLPQPNAPAIGDAPGSNPGLPLGVDPASPALF